MLPTTRELRTFGLVAGLCCLGAAVVLTLGDRPLVAAGLFAASGPLLLLLAAVAPAWLRLLRSGWLAVSGMLAWVVLRVLVVMFFAVVIAPIGLIGRLFAWDPLDVSPRRRAKSGWHHPEPDKRGPDRYEHQY